ncbi:unnamed protein product [Lactuca saligna]|uniref:Uncharacterized protein n=1 Tax=Lactuca saligna TaxID=75948 RepID=A0AA35YIB7_LACSI|nr:unnamed protein product [Lactuca saligna]
MIHPESVSNVAHFWILIVHHSIEKIQISVMQNSLIEEMQVILAEVDKSKKGGKVASSTTVPKIRNQPARKRNSPNPSESEGLDSKTESDIRIEENQPVRNEEEEQVHNKEVRNEEGDNTRTEEPNPNREVTQTFNDSIPSPPPSHTTSSIPITIAPSTPVVSINISNTGAKTPGFSTDVSPPISPFRTNDLDIIFGDDNNRNLGGFTCSPFQIRTESEDEDNVTKGKLKSLHEKIDQLILLKSARLRPKKSIKITGKISAHAYRRIMNHFKPTSLKLQNDLAMKSKVMDALTMKTEKIKVLSLKLENAEKKVKDQLSEKAVMRSCISDVAGLLSDIIETRDPMILITVQKHLA